MQISHRIFRTKNGMDVLLLKRPEKYTVAFSLLIKAGSVFESKKTSGISHFFEHLLFNGTKTYPTEEMLRKRHQELGLSIGATTNYDFIELSGYFPTVSMKDALMVIHEMVFESLIATQMIDKERGIILEEERTRKDNNYIQLWDRVFESRFKKENPLQLPREGTSESIKSLVPAVIKQFYKKYCVSANSTFIMASNRPYAELKFLLENISKKFLGGKRMHKPSLSNKNMTKYKASVVNKPLKQTYSLISFPSYAGDDLFISWQYGFLFDLLYEELNKSLRQERGLVYELDCSLMRPTINVSFSYIQFACDPKNLKTVVDLVFEKIKVLKKGKIDMQTFERIRETGNKTLPMGFDSISGSMGWVRDPFYRYKKVYSPEEYIEARNKITEKDLIKAAKISFDFRKLNLVGLGPISKSDLEKIVNRKEKNLS